MRFFLLIFLSSLLLAQAPGDIPGCVLDCSLNISQTPGLGASGTPDVLIDVGCPAYTGNWLAYNGETYSQIEAMFGLPADGLQNGCNIKVRNANNLGLFSKTYSWTIPHGNISVYDASNYYSVYLAYNGQFDFSTSQRSGVIQIMDNNYVVYKTIDVTNASGIVSVNLIALGFQQGQKFIATYQPYDEVGCARYCGVTTYYIGNPPTTTIVPPVGDQLPPPTNTDGGCVGGFLKEYVTISGGGMSYSPPSLPVDLCDILGGLALTGKDPIVITSTVITECGEDTDVYLLPFLAVDGFITQVNGVNCFNPPTTTILFDKIYLDAPKNDDMGCPGGFISESVVITGPGLTPVPVSSFQANLCDLLAGQAIDPGSWLITITSTVTTNCGTASSSLDIKIGEVGGYIVNINGVLCINPIRLIDTEAIVTTNDGTTYTYANFQGIDLTPYGGGIVPVTSDPDVIAAFAAIGITAVQDGLDFYPVNYIGSPVDVDVKRVQNHAERANFTQNHVLTGNIIQLNPVFNYHIDGVVQAAIPNIPTNCTLTDNFGAVQNATCLTNGGGLQNVFTIGATVTRFHIRIEFTSPISGNIIGCERWFSIPNANACNTSYIMNTPAFIYNPNSLSLTVATGTGFRKVTICGATTGSSDLFGFDWLNNGTYDIPAPLATTTNYTYNVGLTQGIWNKFSLDSGWNTEPSYVNTPPLITVGEGTYKWNWQ